MKEQSLCYCNRKTWPLNVKPQLTTEALYVPRSTESLLAGSSSLNKSANYRSPIVAKKRNRICFPFFHPFYFESRYYWHTVVISLLTPIQLMPPSTNLVPRSLVASEGEILSNPICPRDRRSGVWQAMKERMPEIAVSDADFNRAVKFSLEKWGTSDIYLKRKQLQQSEMH